MKWAILVLTAGLALGQNIGAIQQPTTGGSSALVIGTTTISGSGTGAILYSDGTLLQNDVNITRSLAGQITFSRASIGTTPYDSIIMTNPTAAAAGAQQESPAYNRCGFGWKTTATAASQAVCARDYLLPVQGAAAPTGQINWDFSINGGAYTTGFSILPGKTLIPSGSNATALYSLNSGAEGLGSSGANYLQVVVNGSGVTAWAGSNMAVQQGTILLWSNASGTLSSGSSYDTSVCRISAGVLGFGKAGGCTANGLINLAGATFLDPQAITGATRVLVSLGAADSTSTVTIANAGTSSSVGVIVSGQPATTGQRFACLTTTGQIVSSVTACAGT